MAEQVQLQVQTSRHFHGFSDPVAKRSDPKPRKRSPSGKRPPVGDPNGPSKNTTAGEPSAAAALKKTTPTISETSPATRTTSLTEGISDSSTATPSPVPPLDAVLPPIVPASSPISIRPAGSPMVAYDHPLVAEYNNTVLPNLHRMFRRHFESERIAVCLLPSPICSSGSLSHGKLTVSIAYRKPRKMRTAIKKTCCLNTANFEVVVEKGPDLRFTASSADLRGNHPLEIPGVPGCASGFPILSHLETSPLGSALVGGLLRVGTIYCGMTVYHFLEEPQDLPSKGTYCR